MCVCVGLVHEYLNVCASEPESKPVGERTSNFLLYFLLFAFCFVLLLFCSFFVFTGSTAMLPFLLSSLLPFLSSSVGWGLFDLDLCVSFDKREKEGMMGHCVVVGGSISIFFLACVCMLCTGLAGSSGCLSFAIDRLVLGTGGDIR